MDISSNRNDGDNVLLSPHYLDFASYMMDFKNILAEGQQPVMTKSYKPQVAFAMEKYLNPESLKRHVLHSEKMRQLIEFYAKSQNSSATEIERQVRKIVDEIGLQRNLPIVRWCGIAITAIGKRICNGIYVNEASVRAVKQSLGRNPVLYLPSHRSYMDFILMSYICFHYDIEIPGIAAGMDFHSMFAMGTMLRKTGAFFMRRSFSNDELYWDVFREYMYALVAAYHIGVEFFIEGTRSRNFKALMPKVGLLSMALMPYFTGEVSDITIVPVSVSYERLLEEQLFVYELLGVPKPKESTKGFFKALKIIDERYGRMYLDFGEPISVREFFGHTNGDRSRHSASIGAHLQKLGRIEIELIKELANEIIFEQQRRIIITTFNLVSLYYAARSYSNRNPVRLDEIAEGVSCLKRIFEILGAHVCTDLNCIRREIIETVEIHSNILHFRNSNLLRTQLSSPQLGQQIDVKKLKAHSLSPSTMAVAVPMLSLQLYINPCLFWLASPAYVLTAAMHVFRYGHNSFSTRTHLLDTLYERAKIVQDVFKYEFIIDSRKDKDDFERSVNLLIAHQVLNITSEPEILRINENECCRYILSALAPFLCVYYQLAVTINEFSTKQEFSSKDVFTNVQRRIELLIEGNIPNNVHPYCLALDNLNIALHSFVQSDYLTKNKENGLLRHSSSDVNKSLANLERELLQYCSIMPFTCYYEASKEELQFPSKL